MQAVPLEQIRIPKPHEEDNKKYVTHCKEPLNRRGEKVFPPSDNMTNLVTGKVYVATSQTTS